MSFALGLDVGSTTAKVALIDGAGALVEARIERHHGRPVEALARLMVGLDGDHVAARGVTGTLGARAAAGLAATPVHEVHALARAVAYMHTDAQTVIELGGQDAKLLFMGDGDVQMNDRCAAGCGATLDRVARRLRVGLDVLGEGPLEPSPTVAAKCGVFAETDVVNLVRQGVSPRVAFAALARAVVLQNLAVLARGRVIEGPVLLLGGPHAHLPVLCEAWRETLERRQPVTASVPRHAEHFAAIGAALHALGGGRAQVPLAGLLSSSEEPAPLPQFERREASGARGLSPGPQRVHLGLDAGSTTTKLALLDDDGALLTSFYAASTGDPAADAAARLREALGAARDADASLVVASLGVTGYGAATLAPLLGADAAPVETLAHVEAALAHDPSVDVVVDVGGTDSKIIQLRGGEPADFFVSNQCAAGMGAFFEATAAELGVPLASLAERARTARRAPRFAVGCSIFADTDRVSFERQGYDADEILAGLCMALPRNVFEFVVPVAPSTLGRHFLLTGGVHRNAAVVAAQRAYLAREAPSARVSVAEHPELCGAIGAALAARRTAGPTRFVGFEQATRVRLTVETGEALRCPRCELRCPRARLVPDEGPALLVGNACDRGATLAPSPRRPESHAEDLLEIEARELFRLPRRASKRTTSPPVIGLPRVMGLYRCAPFVLGYLERAGVPRSHIVLSPVSSPSLFAQGSLRGANDPCFPAKVVLSHVDWLLTQQARPIDVLLMPAVTHARVRVRGTTDAASCPIVAACGHTALAALTRGDTLSRRGVTVVLPELCMPLHTQLRDELFDKLAPVLGLDRAASDEAVSAGLAAQAAFAAGQQRRGARVLARARAARRAVAVVLARPYHADPGLSHGVSTELAARGLPVLSISSLPAERDDLLDLSTFAPELTNSGNIEKLWAARVVASDPHLLAVDLSSFRCGQDASALLLLSDLLATTGKPSLRLHDLDEDRPGLSLRIRLDTFVAAARRHEQRLVGQAP